MDDSGEVVIEAGKMSCTSEHHAIEPDGQLARFRIACIAIHALDLARWASKVSEVAELLEGAANESRPLREEFEYRLWPWRRGISM